MIKDTVLFELGFSVKTYLDDGSITFKHTDRPYLLRIKQGIVTSIHDVREKCTPQSFASFEKLKEWHENYEITPFFAKIIAERKRQL